MREELRRGGGLAREETERADRRVGVGVQARPATSARVHPLEPLRRDRGPGVDDDEAAHALGMPGGERHRVVAAHRVADDGRALPAEGVHDADQVGHEVLGRVRGRLRPPALALGAPARSRTRNAHAPRAEFYPQKFCLARLDAGDMVEGRPMFDKLTPSAGRRHLLDGGYALLLLTVAFVTGYLILAPSDLRAKTLARPWPELLPGLVTDWPGPDRPVARARQRQSWPKTVTGKILDADRQPLEGAGIVLA